MDNQQIDGKIILINGASSSGKSTLSRALQAKLDEPFWTAYNYPRGLRDLRTGKKPTLQTRFLVRWWNDNLYFGIRCALDEGESPVIGSKRTGDPAIWPFLPRTPSGFST